MKEVSIALRRVHELLNWPLENLVEIAKLSGGPTSDSWQVRYNNRDYVVRVDTGLACSLGLDRKHEKRLYESLAQVGLAPNVVLAAPEQGVLVRPFISGRSWSRDDLLDDAKLKQLATSLTKLHSLQPAVHHFDLSGAIERYADQLNSKQTEAWAKRALQLHASINERPAVLCHNDLVVQNIIQRQPIGFIDWEYAALGNCLFDLAVVIQHHRMPADKVEVLLKAYFTLADDDTLNDIKKYRVIYAHVLVLWLSVVCKNHSNDKHIEQLKQAKAALQAVYNDLPGYID